MRPCKQNTLDVSVRLPLHSKLKWDTRLPLCCWSGQPSQEDLPAWRCHTQMQNLLHTKAHVTDIHILYYLSFGGSRSIACWICWLAHSALWLLQCSVYSSLLHINKDNTKTCSIMLVRTEKVEKGTNMSSAYRQAIRQHAINEHI